jgi:hypothetical protein
MPRPKKQRGRPVKYQLPEPLDMTPEKLAQTVLKAPPKASWRFEEEAGLTREDRPD